ASHIWAISIRGFNSFFANKLLVMVDGRTVYNPVFGRGFREAHDLALEDVDRIEVISGPGGTLWGANAVNGVINIITKHTRDTQGTYISGALGDFTKDMVAGRYGGKIRNATFKIYGQHFDKDDLLYPDGRSNHDKW